jgi:hypothetical protein
LNVDLKERPDDTVSNIKFQRTVHLRSSGTEQEQLVFGDPVSGAAYPGTNVAIRKDPNGIEEEHARLA